MSGQVAIPSLSGATFKPTGLALDEALDYERWLSIGETLKAMERSVMWWVGDWLRFGERKYGETYSQALEATDLGYQALANAKWVAEKYPEFSTRVENVTWTHHREAAALQPDQRAELLVCAANQGWSVRELKQEINRLKNSGVSLPSPETGIIADLFKAVDHGIRFGTIYADPPWKYDNQGTRAATGNHYAGMSIDQICELPIASLSAPDAHLHLWTTNAFLFQCPKIFEAWGFEFRSSFVWCKTEMGIGNYWRNSHEILLTAIRGDAKRFNDKTLKSWIECSRGQHSAKPEQVRSAIERASPGPFLELFARQPARGWRVWGNQVSRNLLFQDVPEAAA